MFYRVNSKNNAGTVFLDMVNI